MTEKPASIKAYREWLKEHHRVELSRRTRAHYELVTQAISSALGGSPLWSGLLATLYATHEEYLTRTGSLLLRDFNPRILIKPFDSLVEKTFRKNIVNNDRWPREPSGGWYLPSNWFHRINDIARTMLEVKYLDGVEFLLKKLETFCGQNGLPCSYSFEAREEGYYAAHFYFTHTLEIPRPDWDTEPVPISVELQITTQLQELIRKLLHKYYEEARTRPPSPQERPWQWNYRSDEFAANYLGHILHYVEALIVEIRERQDMREGG